MEPDEFPKHVEVTCEGEYPIQGVKQLTKASDDVVHLVHSCIGLYGIFSFLALISCSLVSRAIRLKLIKTSNGPTLFSWCIPSRTKTALIMPYIWLKQSTTAKAQMNCMSLWWETR